MSKVKIKDININDRYVRPELFGCFENPDCIVDNLKVLYEFIDNMEGGIPEYKYGKAYRKILRTARSYAGSRERIISKKQVGNLIKVHYKNKKPYVKIPYTADYIFRAIFAILDEYKIRYIVPKSITEMYGKTRRDCFYKEQSYSYEIIISVDDEQIKRNLNYDLNSDECALARKV